MPCFQSMFEESNAKSIRYKGKTLVQLDTIPIQADSDFLLSLERVDSQWRQGVKLSVEGSIIFDGEEFKKKDLVLWESGVPSEIMFTVKPKKGGLKVWNVWKSRYGATEAWTNGAAMIVEEVEGGQRYHCNDGYPDDDFDDLVFTITKVTR